jgi:hypothetical protein
VKLLERMECFISKYVDEEYVDNSSKESKLVDLIAFCKNLRLEPIEYIIPSMGKKAQLKDSPSPHFL